MSFESLMRSTRRSSSPICSVRAGAAAAAGAGDFDSLQAANVSVTVATAVAANEVTGFFTALPFLLVTASLLPGSADNGQRLGYCLLLGRSSVSGYTSMQTRPLGRTGERVSALGFGCMGLVGWYGERDDDEARATVLAALDSGCTHLDTASSYQLGENEKFVGATIKGRRDEVFLATKYGIVWKEGGVLTIDNSPSGIVATVEASLA